MNQQQEKQFLQLRREYIRQQFGRLNEVQQDAVFHTDGPVLILAGAGSGKTTVLVNRIANLVRFGQAYHTQEIPYGLNEVVLDELSALVADGGKEAPSPALEQLLCVRPVRPYNVLAITFTNKAAGELKNRLETMLGEAGLDINASTFHSGCVRMLRREAERLGFPKSFTIYDTDDQQRAIKEIFKAQNIDDKFLPVKTAISSIGRLKDKLISPAQALAAPADSKTGLVARVYDAYAKRLQAAGAMDFDDLIYYTVRLLEEHADVREYYQNRYRYVLVDEYQDTSVAQFRLVSLLGAHGNVCVVGDDDQSIYRFRGATIENILNFEQHFPGAKVIRLEQNYRSTSKILDAANCVIKNNQGRKGKTLWTENEGGEQILHYGADSEFDEAAHIASIIGQNLRKGANLRDHAILYRMNAQSGPIETYFARAGIPYKIVGGRRFYDRKEVKDMLAYMSVVVNRQDDLRLKRIINEPARKIGTTTIDLVAELAARQGICMLDVIQNMPQYPALTRASSALGNFYQIYVRLCEAHETLPLDAFAADIMNLTGYRTMLDAEGEEGKTRLENIGQLVSSVKAYADQRGPEATLSGFLEEVALITDLDSYDETADVVVLMTMHAAKGLEYDYVFIVGLEEGVFPSEMCKYSEDDLEEERRLCYVGITRARKELYLSNATTRMMFGQTKHNRPSRFLDEIDPSLLSEELSAAARQAKELRERYRQEQNAYVQRGYTSESTLGAGVYTSRTGTGQTAPRAAAQSDAAASGTPRKPLVASGFSAIHAGSAVAPRPASAGQTAKTFAPGDHVEHKVFGRGVVLKATPTAGDTIVEIRFDTVGVKKTMANYAPLTIVQD